MNTTCIWLRWQTVHLACDNQDRCLVCRTFNFSFFPPPLFLPVPQSCTLSWQQNCLSLYACYRLHRFTMTIPSVYIDTLYWIENFYSRQNHACQKSDLRGNNSSSWVAKSKVINLSSNKEAEKGIQILLKSSHKSTTIIFLL